MYINTYTQYVYPGRYIITLSSAYCCGLGLMNNVKKINKGFSCNGVTPMLNVVIPVVPKCSHVTILTLLQYNMVHCSITIL